MGWNGFSHIVNFLRTWKNFGFAGIGCLGAGASKKAGRSMTAAVFAAWSKTTVDRDIRNWLLHFEGIIAHATFNISAGKIEGINNKIKTLRRKGYGYPDDDHFFLKLFDVSRKPYIRNPSSHNFCD